MRSTRLAAVIALTLLPRVAAARDTAVLPTISLAAAMEGEDVTYFHSWLGVAVHRTPHGLLAPFVAGGVEMDVRDWGKYTVLDVRPGVRAGFGLYGHEIGIPGLALYSLVAYHPPSALRPQSLRVGVGLSVPLLMAAWQSGEIIPTMVETTWDLAEKESVFTLRFGWNI